MADTLGAQEVLANHALQLERRFLDRSNPLEKCRNDAECIERYRFRHGTIYVFMALIFNDLKRATARSFALPPMLMLCCALRFFAIGPFYLTLGELYSVTKSSMCRIVHQVTSALIKYRATYSKFPSTEPLDDVIRRFYEIAG